jgi:predicted secreted protein
MPPVCSRALRAAAALCAVNVSRQFCNQKSHKKFSQLVDIFRASRDHHQRLINGDAKLSV